MKTKSAPPKPAQKPKPAAPEQMSLLTLGPPEPAVSARRQRPSRPATPTVEVPKPKPAARVNAKTAKTNPTKQANPKIAKTNSPIVVKPAPAQPAAEPVRIVHEPTLGAMWRMSGKHGVAYVRDAALAGELLATDPKNLAKAAMAVYYDKKGRAFAWQVRFDTDRWEEVLRRLA